MEITGTLVNMLPLQTGQGKNGAWKKQDFIIETQGSFPKKVCISAWGDKVDFSKLVTGQTIKVSFDIESREFNGRWYTDVKAFAVHSIGNGGSYSNTLPPVSVNEEVTIGEVSDDLPF